MRPIPLFQKRSTSCRTACCRINGFIDIPTYAASEIIFPKMSQALAEEGHGKEKYLYERMVSLSGPDHTHSLIRYHFPQTDHQYHSRLAI